MKENKQSNKFGDFLKKSRLTHNTGLKIVSLCFALIFWVYVMDQVNPLMTQTREHIKVELLNQGQLIQNGLILMDQDDYFVDVKIEGRRNDLFEVNSDSIVITADLEGYGKGKSSIPIQAQSTSPDCTIVDLSQKDIKVFLDKLVEIEKSVKLDIKGNPQTGYVKGQLSINPQEILVKGPESYVNSVASLAGVLNLDGFDAGVSKEIPIKPVDNDGNIVKGVELGENYINAHIDIWKGRKVSINPALKGDVKKGYSIVEVKVIPQVMDIQGEKEIIEKINRINTKIIDVSGLTQSTDVRVGLEIPKRVKSQSVETALVKIKVEPLETKIVEVPVQSISFINIPENLDIIDGGMKGEVSIVVEDVESVLDKLTEKDFTLVIDMKDAHAGTNKKIPVTIDSKYDLKTVSIIENRVIIITEDKNAEDNNIDNSDIQNN